MKNTRTKTDIRLLNLTSYVKPEPKENKSKGWVLNGKNNIFYQYIIDRNIGSPTNASINKSYSDLIYGKGLTIKNAHLNTENLLKVKQVLNKKDVRRIVSDFQIFNEASFEVMPNRKGGLESINHIPKNLVVPSIANEDNEIESYFFSMDWKNTTNPVPQEFNAFGDELKSKSIYVIKPYQVGNQYFSDPDYISALPYAVMEEEIANLNVNSIKQGLSGGYIINVPDGNNLQPEEKDTFEKAIKAKLTGSGNASNFILSFNGRDVEVTIVPFPVNDNIHKQWESLNDTATSKLLTAHRATSPSLVGIVPNTGFSSSAEEMEMAELQIVKRVIRPKQEMIIDALEEVLVQYGINVELEFKPLTDVIKTPVALSSVKCSHDEEDFSFLEMYAEDKPDGYELTDGSEYDLQLSAIQNSEQDTKQWKVRYEYTKGTSKTPLGSSRSFCNRMLSMASSGKVFRKEDIEKMSSDGVNGKFAHSGGTYDIFLYGGGVNCYHRWERRIFKKKTQDNGDLYGGNAMQNTTPVNVSEAKRQGFTPEKNSPDVAIAEIDKPNKGSLK